MSRYHDEKPGAGKQEKPSSNDFIRQTLFLLPHAWLALFFHRGVFPKFSRLNVPLS